MDRNTTNRHVNYGCHSETRGQANFIFVLVLQMKTKSNSELCKTKYLFALHLSVTLKTKETVQIKLHLNLWYSIMQQASACSHHMSGFASSGITVKVWVTLFALFTTALKGFPTLSLIISITCLKNKCNPSYP